MVPKPGPDRNIDEQEILRYIKRAYSPAIGTADVAQHFDISNQNAADYLHRLQDAGYIETRKIGRARIWWLTTDGEKEIRRD